MAKNARCLYSNSLSAFIKDDNNAIFGALCDCFHGDVLTTTREVWKSEISIKKDIIRQLSALDGQIVFEYDIPLLGLRCYSRALSFVLSSRSASIKFWKPILIRFWITR